MPSRALRLLVDIREWRGWPLTMGRALGGVPRQARDPEAEEETPMYDAYDRHLHGRRRADAETVLSQVPTPPFLLLPWLRSM